MTTLADLLGAIRVRRSLIASEEERLEMAYLIATCIRRIIESTTLQCQSAEGWMQAVAEAFSRAETEEALDDMDYELGIILGGLRGRGVDPQYRWTRRTPMMCNSLEERAGIILALSRELKALMPADADSRMSEAWLRLIVRAQDLALDLESPEWARIEVDSEDAREIMGVWGIESKEDEE